MIVIGSMISLAYYLRVLAAIWLHRAARRRRAGGGQPATGRPALAGGSPEADVAAAAPRRGRRASRCCFGAATLFFGIVPSPLFDLARDAGAAFTGLV